MKHALPAWLLLVLPIAMPAAAQQGRPIEGVVRGEGAAKIKIAVPDARAGAGLTDSARELVETIRADLEFSGYFDVVDPTLYRLVPAEDDAEVRHDDWIAIGADTVTRIHVNSSGSRLDIRVRLYQNESRSELFATRYGGSDDLVRRIAHQAADDIIRQRTGQEGVSMTRIAFVSKYGEGKEIYLMDYDGRRIRRLTTSHTINLTPVWSPDGSELAYVSWRGRQPGVYAMTATGERLQLSTVGGNLSSAPDWSADGRKLVYSSDKPGNTEIFLLDRTSGRNTQLTRHPAIDTSPAFSPNGREIAFTSDRTGTPQIYLMDVEGLNVRRISWTGGYNDSAAWSPSGDRIAYVSRIDGRFDVMLLDLTTNRTSRLTRGEGNSENPAWAPDGRHLVFASDRAGTYDIYTMRADGTSVRRLTQNGNCFTPHWSP
jgi:TolB protein